MTMRPEELGSTEPCRLFG